MAKVKIEGVELDIDDSICKSDKSLKDALVPFYPGAANADIKRETKGETMVVTVTKRAGTKGARRVTVATALDAAPEDIGKLLQIGASGRKRVRRNDVDEAILEMLERQQVMDQVLSVLEKAEPQPAQRVPTGF